MTKEDIEVWCKENNHIIVDLSSKNISPETVIEIAKASTGVDDITLRTRKPQYVFARFLVIDYLKNYLENNQIAQLTKLTHDVICYANNKQQVLSIDPKYLKKWQREAVSFFKDKINEIKSK